MTTRNPYAPPRIWPWTDEPWYLAQRARWNALQDAGWKFGPAVHPRRDHVSMEMTLARDGWPIESHSFWVSKKNKLPEDVHSEVLALCERAARASSTPAEQGEACPHLRRSVGDPVVSQCLDCGASLRQRGCPTCGADLQRCPECKTEYVDGSGYCRPCDTFTGPSDEGLRRATPSPSPAPDAMVSDERDFWRGCYTSVVAVLNEFQVPTHRDRDELTAADRVKLFLLPVAPAPDKGELARRAAAAIQNYYADKLPPQTQPHIASIIEAELG